MGRGYAPECAGLDAQASYELRVTDPLPGAERRQVNIIIMSSTRPPVPADVVSELQEAQQALNVVDAATSPG